MPPLNKHTPVEKILLPPRYRAHADTHSMRLLCTLYEDLKREHYQALQRVEEANRESWSWERLYSTLIDRLDLAEAEIRRLAEAGRYAVYGKPQLSPVDDCTDEAYTDGEVDDNKINNK